MTTRPGMTTLTSMDTKIVVLITRESTLPAGLAVEPFQLQIYNDFDWLRSIEEIRAGGTSYLIARERGGRVLGVLPVYWGDHTLRGFYSPHRMYLHLTHPELEASLAEPAMIVGTRAGYSCEFVIDRSLSEDLQSQLLSELINEADRLRTELDLSSIAAMYIERSDLELARRSFGDGQIEFETSGSARMEIPADFDAYLASFGSKRAREVRREQRIFIAAGYSVTRTEGSHPALPELLAKTESRYGHPGDAEAERREARIFDRNLGDKLLSFVLEKAGEVVGVATALRKDRTISMRSLGLDYNSLQNAFEYFNLVFYAPIEWCISSGIKYIDWGIGSTEAKVRRGATMHGTSGILRTGRSPASEFQTAQNSQLIGSPRTPTAGEIDGH